MPADSLGLATLQVGLTTQGINSELERELSPMLTQIGGRAGRDLSDAIGQGVRQSTAIQQAFDRTIQQAGIGQAARRVGSEAADSLAQGIRQGSSQVENAIERSVQSGGDSAGRRAGRDAADGMADGVRQGSSQVENAMSRIGSQGGQAGGDAGGAAMGAGILGGVKGKLGGAAGIAAALGAMLAVAGTKAAGMFVDALKDGLQQEATLDMTQARLGVDDQTMQRIGLAAGNAFNNAWGESTEGNVDTIRKAFQAGLIDSDSTTTEMQKVAESIIGVNDLIEGDLTETTKAASILMKNGLAKDSTEAFDLIVQGYKKAGLAGDDIIDSIKEYSAGWKNVGITGSEALALVSQTTADLGADSTDRAADAVREMGRRITEEGEAMVEGMDNIGLAGQDMYDSLKRGGPEAFAALDQLLDKVRTIEDPVQRNAAILAVFGDTAGDFQDVFARWDPSEAVNKFGQVGGAANSALTQMGSNAQSSITAAFNSIETSSDKVKGALAQAFAPALSDLANWVSQHQPEIIGFFSGLGQAALGTGEIFARFVQGTLNYAALMLDGLSLTFGNVAELLGGFVGFMGDVAGAIPGMEGVSDKLHEVGDAIGTWKEGMQGAADSTRNMADKVGQAATGMGDLRRSFAENTAVLQQSAEVSRALGAAVTSIPGEKSITIRDNTPEVDQALRDLGLTVTHMPDGSTEITANTAEAQAKLDAWLTTTRATSTAVTVEAKPGGSWMNMFNRLQQFSQGNSGSNPPQGIDWNFADGGLFRGRGGPRDDANLIAISDKEHLAFITQAQAVSPATLPFLDAINNGWVPPAELLHGMVPGFAQGGLVNAQAFAQSRDDLPYQYGAVGPDAYDCSGFQSDIYAMLTGKQLGVRHFTTESDFESLGFVPGLGGPNDYSIGIMRGGGGPNSHMAGTLGGMNVEAGANGVQAGSGAQGAADLPLQYHLPLSGDPGGMTGGLGADSFGGLGGGGGFGGGSGGGGGFGSGGAGSGGFGSGVAQQGYGTPVVVTNWPSGFGTGTTGTGFGTDTTGSGSTVQSDGFGTSTPGALQGAPMGRSLNDPMGLQAPMQPPTDPNAQAFGAGPTTDPMVQKHQQFFQELGQQGIDFVGENWREMLNTIVGVGLGNARVGGGDTYNISGDPRLVATAIARNQARKTRAMQIRGGYGRP